MRLSPVVFATLIWSLPAAPQPPLAQIPSVTPVSFDARAAAHASPDWKLVEPHLPDPKTATADALETQGDLLRIRRFPEDALDFYNYALQRGGDPANLLNKLGVTQLELGNVAFARAYFQRVVKLRRNDPLAWNNLGAVDFMQGSFTGAMLNYKRAIKLDKRSAVYHSNLGMVYVQNKDFSSAKRELTVALHLDPEVFNRPGYAGASLHLLSTTDRARFCFQMAKVYASLGNEPEMLHSLETASEAGMNIQAEMAEDRELARFAKDPRVIQLAMVSKSLRNHRAAPSTVASALPQAAPPASMGPATTPER